jgi:hypothetical protein
MVTKALTRIGFAAASLVACAGFAAAVPAQADRHGVGVDEAAVLSEFGGRPAFSPDGKHIAFVGHSYGDAFEIDLATRKVRNLTAHIPHNGVMRIQYLPNGDYLVTAPRIQNGPDTRAHLEMWVLDRNLEKGLQPLGEQVFEGIAVSRRRNLVAWTVVEPELKPGENWALGFARPTKRYIAEIIYREGRAVLTGKREIMATLPRECSFIEPQDFRDGDRELIYSCMGPMTGGQVSISVMGTRLPNGASVTYYRHASEYDEVEGIAPGGDWAAVECGKQDKAALPPLDICRLELKPDGTMSTLVIGSEPGSTRGISNPVISPDGQWIAFQRSDSSDPDIGAGTGVYLMKLPAPAR